MESVIIGIVAASVVGCIALVWGTDRLVKRRFEHVRRLEKQNVALRAHLEVARAKMRQMSGRRAA